MSEKLPSSYEQAIGTLNASEQTLSVTITADTSSFRNAMDGAWWAIAKLRGIPGDRELRPNAWPRLHPLWPLWRYGRRQK